MLATSCFLYLFFYTEIILKIIETKSTVKKPRICNINSKIVVHNVFVNKNVDRIQYCTPNQCIVFRTSSKDIFISCKTTTCWIWKGTGVGFCIILFKINSLHSIYNHLWYKIIYVYYLLYLCILNCLLL